MKNIINIGFIGIGCRGQEVMKTMLDIDCVKVVAVCDVYQDRVEKGIEIASSYGVNASNDVKGYLDYHEILNRDDIDAVVITTSWYTHIPIAIDAMKAGKRVGLEVGGAYSIQQCWDLVKVSEETKIPCMLLENCCYGRTEMAILNMIKKDVFGEIIHCQGGYEHDLRDEISCGRENRHYRFNEYLNRNTENYPTHELGPIAKYLNINRGNRMLSLVSMSSKTKGLYPWMKQHKGNDYDALNFDFKQGDIVTTMIKCANGETILLTLDTSLPRPYSRGGRVQGVKGIWMEDNNSIYLDNISPSHKWESFDKYLEQYEHPLWKKYREEGVKSGHDGMDYLVYSAFAESVLKQIDPPIDVYDAATWMSISCLAEISIQQGSTPVDIPDFTNGKWHHREKPCNSMYQLDIVNDELF